MSDPEAEYLAAKDAFMNAQERLTTAKRAMEPIWKAREEKQRLDRIAQYATIMEARLVSGKFRFDSCQNRFWDAVLSHEEIYRGHGDIGAADWERRVTITALQRYHERMAA